VENDPSCLDLMTEVFQSHKARVRPIADSETADQLINREKFDGIFLDLEMPALNGVDLGQRVRQSSWNKLTPVVIVTGGDMQRAFASGATFFLQKPMDRQKLNGLFRTVRPVFAENRRRSLRAPMQADVTCTVGARSVRGTTWNLSLGGIQVEVGDLTPGDAVRLSFRLPSSGATIDAFGTVVWARQNRQGIQFKGMTHKSEEEVRQFIAHIERS
jgi:DNA-binding response OmpR family regulator